MTTPEGLLAKAKGPKLHRGGCSAWLFSLVFLFVLCEAVSRIYLFRLADDNTFYEYSTIHQKVARWLEGDPQIMTHPFLGTILRPGMYQRGGGTLSVNSKNYRGPEIVLPKPDGEFRIVCIGGSTTMDDPLTDEDGPYPARLQEELRAFGYNVTVVNGGISGWTTYQVLMSYAFRDKYLEPDLIILHEAPNDWALRLTWPPEKYTNDMSGVDRFRQLLLRDPTNLDQLLSMSTLFRILLVNVGYDFPDYRINTENVFMPDCYANDYAGQVYRDEYPSGIFTEIPAEQMLEVNKPVYFERNLESLVAMAHADKVRVAFCTVAWDPSWDVESRPQALAWDRGMTEMNERLRRVAAKNLLPVIDLEKSMPRNESHWVDLVHTNRDGSQLKARLVAAFLHEHEIIPRSYLLE